MILVYSKEFSELAELWRIALSRPLHGSSCGCSTPVAMTIGPLELELDILDYLGARYELNEYPSWARAVQARETDHNSGLPVWLAGMCREPDLQNVPWPMVMADVVALLSDLAAHAGGRLTPASTLPRGWLTNGS